MFAIVQTGGKQYRVEPGASIRVERIEADLGSVVELPVLLVADGEQLLQGDLLGEQRVSAEVVEQILGKKLYIRKYKSGIQYRRRTGHRQRYTVLKIAAIPGLEGSHGA
jgi:large subunit ribosomal protein L21